MQSVSAVADLAGEGYHSAIVDAVFDHELEAIGQAALDYGLSVGASGMGLGLARGLDRFWTSEEGCVCLRH